MFKKLIPLVFLVFVTACAQSGSAPSTGTTPAKCVCTECECAKAPCCKDSECICAKGDCCKDGCSCKTCKECHKGGKPCHKAGEPCKNGKCHKAPASSGAPVKCESCPKAKSTR